MIKKLLKKGLGLFGMGVHQLKHAYMVGEENHLGWLASRQIKAVIDIGANDGGFAAEIRPEVQRYENLLH